MADFISILSTDEAKRLSKSDIETLCTLQAKANGDIPTDEECKEKMKEYVQKRCKELQGDVGYAESLKKQFV